MVEALLPDGLIAALVAFSAITVIVMRDLRRAVMLFFVFCILMAVVWFRLALPLLGAVEVCIGALMTGFVLWHALRLLPGFPGPDTIVPWRLESRSAGLILSLTGTVIFMGFSGAAVFYFFQGAAGSEYTWYAVSGIPVAGAGFFALSYQRHLLRRVFAFNMLGSGVFLLIVCFAKKRAFAMDVPFVMVTSGLLVAFFASLMVVILIGRSPVTGEPQASGGVETDAC